MADDRPVDLFAADGALSVAQTMNLDPRQGTLHGFELPADALASLRERESLGASGRVGQKAVGEERANAIRVDGARPHAQRAADAPSTGVIDTAGAGAAQDRAASADTPNAGAAGGLTDGPARNESSASVVPGNNTPAEDVANIAPPRRQASARRPAERVASAGPAADASSNDALAQTMAALQAMLADERRAARESRKLVSVAIATLFVVLVLGVVQTVVSMRAARESAAAQEKTGALLRAQQTELAAFVDAASAASADIRGVADSLGAKLAALPSQSDAAQPPALKPAPKSAHPRRTTEKTRGSMPY